jgi:hypothetical protein
MERLYHHISVVRNTLFSCNAQSTHRRRKCVSKMDPLVRSALVETLQEELQPNPSASTSTAEATENSTTATTTAVSKTLEDLQIELQTAQVQYERACTQEQFLSVRTHSYQKVLDTIAVRIKQQQQQQQKQAKETQQQQEEEEGRKGDSNVEGADGVDDIEAGRNQVSAALETRTRWTLRRST